MPARTGPLDVPLPMKLACATARLRLPLDSRRARRIPVGLAVEQPEDLRTDAAVRLMLPGNDHNRFGSGPSTHIGLDWSCRHRST